MKRVRIDLSDVAAYDNLVSAVLKAASGKRGRRYVQTFLDRLDTNIETLRKDILEEKTPLGIYFRFTIFDPKKRTIHAACFQDRVLHHASINYAGPILDRALAPSTFACRPGKGPLAAVKWVQHCMRRFPWYVKVDIKRYFDSIDHAVLHDLLKRRLKGDGFLKLLGRIIQSYRTKPGKGLPIGSLTSQHFANYYLDGPDRFILEHPSVCAHARYMDDTIWWCADRMTAKRTVMEVKEWLKRHRLLELKENVQVNRSLSGVTFCGFRVLPRSVRLTKRRRGQYSEKRKSWETAYQAGRIDALELQSAYASVYAITSHADSGQWRRQELLMRPCPEV
jgi:retron-type reverse transcriptase